MLQRKKLTERRGKWLGLKLHAVEKRESRETEQLPDYKLGNYGLTEIRTG
jgi:hypothetical protein